MQATKLLPHTLWRAQVTRRFQIIDKNNDRQLTQAEFMTFFKSEGAIHPTSH